MLSINKNNRFTPRIKLMYADLEPILQEEEEMGYQVYSGKSAKTGEVHHIRVFNEKSKMAKENLNLAMTIFLRETLRLCTLNKEVIIQETLEFFENKLCYAVKPLTSPVLPTNSTEFPRMMEDLIEDLKFLTNCGSAQIHGARIWQVVESELYSKSENSSKCQYFVQDWNQVLWKSQEREEKKLVGKHMMASSTMASNTVENENVCQLGLAMLEIFCEDRKGLEALLEIGGRLYQKNMKCSVEEILANESKKESYSNLLVAMLDESPMKRPTIQMLRERLSSIAFEERNHRKIEIIEEPSIAELKSLEQVQKIPLTTSGVQKISEALNGEFIKEISQLPLELTEKDFDFYKTIEIKNNGKEIYPTKTFIQCVSSKDNARVRVPQLQPGKIFAAVLIIKSPVKPGKYSSTWAFIFEKPDGTVHEFGKRFEIHFEIIGDNTNYSISDSNHTYSNQVNKPKPKVPVYSKEITEKAVQIKEVFPQYNIDDICEYISKSPQKTLDELFSEYMSRYN